jgi:SSS family solute:Na+ symporter
MYMQAAQPGIVPVLVLPTYLFQHTSALLGGVAMGGIVISLISSIGGLSLGIGTMLANDILAPRLAIHEGRAMLKLERIVVLGVMGVAAVIAIANEDSQVLFWNYLSMALRGCGVFLPLTFAIFLPRYVAKRWAVISMLLATVVSLGLTLAGAPWNPLFSGLAASLICLVPGLLSPQQEKEVPAAEL